MTEFDYLRMAETSLSNALMYRPGTYEVERLEMAVADIQSRMTEDALNSYNAKKNTVATAAEREMTRIAMIKAMEENRERPSH